MTSALDLAISQIEDEVEVIQKSSDATAEDDHVVLLACLTRAVCLLVRVCAER